MIRGKKAQEGNYGKIIGIDLGTTNSLVAVWQDGESRLIPNAFGEYLTPSVVSIEEDGTIYVGKTAKERLASHPEDTASVLNAIWEQPKISARKEGIPTGRALVICS